ncbi:hypothetical protein HELRODRAFT_166711 [Helobdella robusta]|uniref:Alpha-1,4-N-acetylglucosaminyltransferase n=1 Tax=Helobdella robusta TaxID=6412 RepID=T1EYE7_HELRO|nr:hypothetical protein HELRODRAFT_166711 [Helobdella robusta]ESO11696.1 hypothetical protein HELRODRAFT_166711 [Helobdella robusta]
MSRTRRLWLFFAFICVTTFCWMVMLSSQDHNIVDNMLRYSVNVVLVNKQHKFLHQRHLQQQKHEHEQHKEIIKLEQQNNKTASALNVEVAQIFDKFHRMHGEVNVSKMIFYKITTKPLNNDTHGNDFNKTSTTSKPQQQFVPKIAHIIWFYPNETEFRFHQAMSLLSLQRFFKPRKIFFWHDTLPTGRWWLFAQQIVAHFLLVPYKRPTKIFNYTVSVPEHQSDVARIQLLREYGGLYIDLDVVLLRPLDPLLEYETTMGAETPSQLGSGFILAKENSAFLKLWLDSYSNNFNDNDWNYHSTIMPMKLAKQHPQLVHIEWFSINRPNWFERDFLYRKGKLWDWSENYAVHLWYRECPDDYNPTNVREMNTTVAEVFTFIYFNERPQWKGG